MGAPTWPSVPDPDPTIHAVIHGPVNGQLG